MKAIHLKYSDLTARCPKCGLESDLLNICDGLSQKVPCWTCKQLYYVIYDDPNISHRVKEIIRQIMIWVDANEGYDESDIEAIIRAIDDSNIIYKDKINDPDINR